MSDLTYVALLAAFARLSSDYAFDRTLQLFGTTAANGAGSLAALFKLYGGVRPVSVTLTFRINDSNYVDDSDSFLIMQSSATGALAKPAGRAMLIVWFGAVGAAMGRQ